MAQRFTEGHMARGKVDFHQLLSPAVSSTKVAARGFMNLLRLATMGHLAVRQQRPFGDIAVASDSQTAD